MASSFDNEMETPEMETLSSLAENLVYRLPGCSDVMIRKSLQEVYRDFCRRSCCLCGRRQFTLTSGDIFVAPMFGGLIDCIVEVKYNHRILGKYDYCVNGPRISFREELIPDEDCDDSQLPKVEIKFIEMPNINSEQVPSWFVQKHGDDICAGVLCKLMAMIGKPWSDQQQASTSRIQYENAACEARLRYYSNRNDGHIGTALGNDELL